MTQSRKRGEGTFWQKTAYIAANDNNTVAIYRFLMGLMGAVIIGLLTHYGNSLAATQEAQGLILAAHTTSISVLTAERIRDNQDRAGETGAIHERLKMIEDRDVRILDRLNTNTNEITALKTLSVLPRR